MGKFVDLTNMKFGRWTVVAKTNDRNNSGCVKWECVCTCGKIKEVSSTTLIQGSSKSCGCTIIEKNKKRKKIHGLNEHKLASVLNGMKQRCGNKNNTRYKHYGMRGIKVCDEWRDTKSFCEWAILNGYKDGLQIDRIDNNGNYEPLNCRWVTNKFNNQLGNKRLIKISKTGYVGVHKSNNGYKAVISYNGKQYHLGVFENIEKAVIARIKKEIEFYGEQKTNKEFKV